jgi:tetratricopeptide (TPR) repeat protein
MTRSVLAAIVLIAALTTDTAAAPTLYVFVGSTDEENRDVQEAAWVLECDYERGKQVLLQLIERNPDHELANALLARTILRQTGDARGAYSRIEKFMDRADPTPATQSTAEDIAKALGNDALSIKCRKLSRDWHMTHWQNWREHDDLLTDPEAAERLGRMAEAESLLTPGEKDDPKTRVFKYSNLGEFYLRQGKYAEAEEALAGGLAEATRAMPDWCDGFRLDRAGALWALGRRDEALEDSLDVAERLAAEGYLASHTQIAEAICITASLSQQQNRRDEQIAQRIDQVKRAARPFFDKNGPMLHRAALSICSDTAQNMTAPIENALQGAPYWDEGLWCAFYIGLVDSDAGERLHGLLPPESEQKKLLNAIRQGK